MKTVTTQTLCDIGSIRIFGRDFCIHFGNGVGDVPTKVTIHGDAMKQKRTWPKGKFLGSFYVRKGNSVHLSGYDCEDSSVFTFPVGRWFVFRGDEADMTIVLVDRDVA